MKTRSFIYSEVSRTTRRTYGGSNYELAVYEITGGKLEHLGNIKACTAGHKGESSEAWSVVIEKRPEVLRLLAKRAKAKGDAYLLKQATTERGYHRWQFRDLGVTLEKV